MRARRERDDAAGAPAGPRPVAGGERLGGPVGGAAVEVCELYESATRTQMAARADINAMIAWAWAQRGDRARAVQFRPAQPCLGEEHAANGSLRRWRPGRWATRPRAGPWRRRSPPPG